MNKHLSKMFSVITILALMLMALPMQSAGAVSPDIVISQVYGGGGNSGATYTHDFVELFNLGSSTVSLAGWSIQYASATGTGNFGSTTTQITPLSGSLAPGQYLLVQEASNAAVGSPLPTPDVTDSSPIAMAAGAGKVALANTTASLGCNGGSTPCNASQLAQIVDLVGYGTGASGANFFEGSGPAPTISATLADFRNSGGCVDTDNNATDFSAGAPAPRNTASPLHICTRDLTINNVTLDEGNAGTTSFDFTVSLTIPAGASGVTFDIATADDTASSVDDYVAISLTSQTIPAGTSSYSFSVVVNGDATIETDETFFVNVTNVAGANITDGQGLGTIRDDDTPVCEMSYTHIYDIQGSGASTPIPGSVTTQGVVVGDYEGPSPTLRGFYLQDMNGDGSASTSDGIFVFNGNNNNVSLGDVVRVTGTAAEFQDQTQISASSIINCGTDTVAPVDVTFPVPSATYLEQYEGMLVRLPQTMYVTEHFQLGRFGQVVLSSGGRLQQPTNVVAPGAPAIALQAANNLNRIIVDDALNNQNPDPILFGRGGNPLSATNTLRGGDTATGIVGVMTYTWAGNAASGNAYRVRPINALGGGVPNFQSTNPRPTSAPVVGGTLKVTGMNLLNFFNTFDGLPDTVDNCTGGVGGMAMDCRGADTPAEFNRQWPKTVAAILALNPDVLGVNEIENDGYDSNSAIQFLADKLNASAGAGTYAFIDVDASTGQVNAMGTDAIKVGLLYKPGVVTPIGQTSSLNSVEFVNGGDSAPRSRPSIAQAFQVNSTGAVFIVDVNHLKSKSDSGLAATSPTPGICVDSNPDNDTLNCDQGDGQGYWNDARTNSATELMNWLATDPTGVSDVDILLVGDYNSYAMEDPITVIKDAGFTNLIASFLGPDAYSYVFDGQWGYLDHALASASIVSQVTGVGDHHINSDEPSVLDYNTDFKSAGQIASLYAPDQFRVSDHDPVLVGLDLLHYNFTGFFQPVDNAPVFNSVKAGNSVPVKFSLGGDQGLNIFLNGYPLSRPIACDSSVPPDPIEQTVTAGGSSLAYDPLTDQYTYVWKTNKSWAGTCRQLVVIFRDGTLRYANFSFK